MTKQPIVVDELIPEKLNKLELRIVEEATHMNDFILKKQNKFSCWGCYPAKDTIAIYPNITLRRYITSSHKYLFIEFKKFSTVSGMECFKLRYENKINTGVYAIDYITYLFDLQNKKWEYIGGKVSFETAIVEFGYNYLESNTLHEVITNNDSIWINKYRIHNLGINQIPDFVEQDRLTKMKLIKEQLLPCITVMEWWSLE